MSERVVDVDVDALTNNLLRYRSDRAVQDAVLGLEVLDDEVQRLRLELMECRAWTRVHEHYTYCEACASSGKQCPDGRRLVGEAQAASKVRQIRAA